MWRLGVLLVSSYLTSPAIRRIDRHMRRLAQANHTPGDPRVDHRLQQLRLQRLAAVLHGPLD